MRDGWPQIQGGYPDAELSFFAAGGLVMKDISVADGALVAESAQLKRFWEATSGGRTCVEPVFDHYIVYGLGLKLALAVNAYLAAIKAAQGRGRLQPIADNTLVEMFVAATGTSLMAETLPKLRRITDAPALVIAAPFFTAGDDQGWVRRVQKRGDEARIDALFRDACTRLAERSSAAFLPQPGETRAAFRLLTAPHFSTGRTMLLDYPGEDDRSHKNAAFGAIVLRAALDRIGEATR